ncbi:oligosaccharide flippase family protein [Xanthobacter flavus]|uniref:oligosaccharide flippase family protein n=1 Tax=Xanthobacter flavus TaxID=281 RepID=UPI001AE511FB|nr:oligosaccharide flippase family protein [Xanthobacter flavus]MBP2151656.1 O-antigen/teichoic acid export membrane protein [Xanthobacter flavus]
MAFLSQNAWAGLWSVMLQWSRIGLNAAVFIVLSRWIGLSDIGAVAAAQAPVLMFQSAFVAAVPESVVQEREPSEIKLASYFWMSVIVGLASSILLLCLGPTFTRLVGEPEVLPFFQALSAGPLILSIACVHEGLLRKSLNMRFLAVRTTIASSIAGTASIILALRGFEGWAMVAFILVNSITSTTLTLVSHPWRPAFVIDLNFLKGIGPKLGAIVGRYWLSSITTPLIQLVATAQLGLATGGTLQLAFRLQTLLSALVVAPLRFIALPLFARVQGNSEALRRGIVRAISAGSCIASPVYVGMLAVAPDLLPLLLGQSNGGPTVELFRLISVYGPFEIPVSIVNQALVAGGMATVVFRRTIAIYFLVIIPCVVAAFHSAFLVCIVYSVGASFFGLTLSAWLARKYYSVNSVEFLVAFARPLVAALFMWLGIEAMHSVLSSLPASERIVILIAFGGMSYPVLLFLIARPQMMALWSLLTGRKAE